jgi:hypothetical protein
MICTGMNCDVSGVLCEHLTQNQVATIMQKHSEQYQYIVIIPSNEFKSNLCFFSSIIPHTNNG